MVRDGHIAAMKHLQEIICDLLNSIIHGALERPLT